MPSSLSAAYGNPAGPGPVRPDCPWPHLRSSQLGCTRQPEQLQELTGEDTGDYAGYLAAQRAASGFVDDTRALLSIPAQHDLARRIDAGYLARLLLDHRPTEDEAIETATDLAYRLPREAYARRTE
ncbi:hypothetical protein [Micromonospora musae]|uniref:hypothetical protein n=1 Tax=Micromonospora musae TaxID=1894970 RepID=UPI00343C8297